MYTRTTGFCPSRWFIPSLDKSSSSWMTGRWTIFSSNHHLLDQFHHVTWKPKLTWWFLDLWNMDMEKHGIDMFWCWSKGTLHRPLKEQYLVIQSFTSLEWLFVTFLEWLSDLQRSGIKRSRLESSGNGIHLKESLSFQGFIWFYYYMLNFKLHQRLVNW